MGCAANGRESRGSGGASKHGEFGPLNVVGGRSVRGDKKRATLDTKGLNSAARWVGVGVHTCSGPAGWPVGGERVFG